MAVKTLSDALALIQEDELAAATLIVLQQQYQAERDNLRAEVARLQGEIAALRLKARDCIGWGYPSRCRIYEGDFDPAGEPTLPAAKGEKGG